MQVVKTQLKENLYAVVYLSKMFHSSITIIVPMSCQDNNILTLGNLSCLYPYFATSFIIIRSSRLVLSISPSSLCHVGAQPD